MPAGYNYDLINDDVILTRAQLKGGRIVLPDGMSYGSLVFDPEFPDEPLKPAVLAKIETFRKAGLPVFSAAEAGKVAEAAAPDAEGPFTFAHRRAGATDIYFVEGTGAGEMTFRAAAPSVEVWNAVTGLRAAAQARRTADGRTTVALDLPTDGSAFVVFRKAAETAAPHMERRHLGGEISIPAPWHVTFAYHPGIASAPPAPVTLDRLVDFTTRNDLKYFAGTATYRARVTLDAAQKGNLRELALGALPSGLASVKVNGVDCGVVWCAPWTADVKGALRERCARG